MTNQLPVIMANEYDLEKIAELEITFKTAILNRTSTDLFNKFQMDLETGDFLFQLMGTTLLETASKCGNGFAENRLKARVRSMKPLGLVKLMDVLKKSKIEDSQVAPIDLVKRLPVSDVKSQRPSVQRQTKRVTEPKTEPAQTSDYSRELRSRKVPLKSTCPSSDVTQEKKRFKYTLHSSAVSSNQTSHKNVKVCSNNQVFECNLCQRTFKTSQNLTRHQRTIHSVERNFSCRFCDKKFKTNCARTDHMQVHQNSNDRMVCDKCGETFTFKKGLRRHLQIQHEGKCQYKCGFCTYESKRKDNLGRHVKDIHTKINLNKRFMKSA